MKLAEALSERAAAQEKISELSMRLQRVVVVQEGSPPNEDPTELLQDLSETVQQLQMLITRINRTNIQTPLSDGRSIMEYIAQRDVIRMEMGVLDTLLYNASNPQFRTRSSEIKIVSTIDVAQLQRNRDALAKSYREVDNAIQAANWATDLVD